MGTGRAGCSTSSSEDASPLLDVAAYHDYLTDNWEKTQRLIKGKINED